MTKTTFSLRLHLLLLLLLPPLYASAQEWTTRVGEVRKEQATTSRIGRNHAEEGLSDEELAASGRGYSVNGMFIGMVPVGLDRDQAGVTPHTPEFPFTLTGVGQEPIIVNGLPLDTVVNGHRLHLTSLTDYRTERNIRWVTLEELRQHCFPNLDGACVFTINKFIIPNSEGLYRIDRDFIYRVEKLSSADIEGFRDIPAFNLVRIFTRTPHNVYRGPGLKPYDWDKNNTRP